MGSQSEFYDAEERLNSSSEETEVLQPVTVYSRMRVCFMYCAAIETGMVRPVKH